MAALGDLDAQAIIAFDIGRRFAAQYQRLRGIKRRPTGRFAIDQSMQQVQHMGLGRHAGCQGHFNRSQHGLLIVMQDERQNVDHLAVAARFAQHLILQLPEGLGQFREWRTIAQGPRLALDHSQIVPPVVDCSWWQMVTALDQAFMFTQDLALGSHDNPFGVDPKTDRAVRK